MHATFPENVHVDDLSASLSQLLNLMRDHGADRVYAKKLSPNDNSKNQVYLGGGFGALNVIPHGEIVADTRPMAGSKQLQNGAMRLDGWGCS